MSRKFRYIVASDGSIKAKSKGELIALGDDVLIELSTSHSPSSHYWDFDVGVMREKTDAQVHAAKENAANKSKAKEKVRKDSVNRLKQLLPLMDAKAKEAFEILCSLTGVDLS